jgi:hypothetical protein
MEAPSPWGNRVRRASRRFTTFEGWREVGQGVYSAAGSSIRFIVVNPEFEDGYSFSGVPSWTRPGKPRMFEVYSATSNYRPGTIRDTPDDVDLIDGQHELLALPLTSTSNGALQKQLEPPYHIFSNRKKWVVVWIIGTAGLFSGLSSNIYFPSLDAIAKVSKAKMFERNLHEVFLIICRIFTSV